MIKKFSIATIVSFTGLVAAAPAYAMHTVTHTREMFNLQNVEIFVGALIFIVTALIFSSHLLFDKDTSSRN